MMKRVTKDVAKKVQARKPEPTTTAQEVALAYDAGLQAAKPGRVPTAEEINKAFEAYYEKLERHTHSVTLTPRTVAGSMSGEAYARIVTDPVDAETRALSRAEILKRDAPMLLAVAGGLALLALVAFGVVGEIVGAMG